MTFGTGSAQESINFTNGNITIKDIAYGTSKAYSLHEVATKGIEIHTAVSLIGFISYGSTVGIEKLPEGNQPNLLSTATPRYSIFEVSYDGCSGGADITNISQYGGSINLAFLSNKIVQAFVGNTLNTTSMFRELANASSFTGSESTHTVYLDGSGKFLRIIGTNVFPIGPVQNPYPKYNTYLQSLFEDCGTKSIVKDLTNLAPGATHGGQGSAGYLSSSEANHITPDTKYNVDYHFEAYLNKVSEPIPPEAPNGTYSAELRGYLCATIAVDDQHKVQSYKYDNLSITIAADDLQNSNLYMTNFIYQAATMGAGIKVTYAGCDDLINDFGEGDVKAGILFKVAGDFAEGITCGFLGSSTISDSVPVSTLAELTSYEWWQNPLLAYEPAQPSSAYYSAYGNIVSTYSNGNNGSSFSRGGVYGSPYDDRFGLNLISPTDETDEMRITLLPDGDLSPDIASMDQ